MSKGEAGETLTLMCIMALILCGFSGVTFASLFAFVGVLLMAWGALLVALGLVRLFHFMKGEK